MSTQMVAERPTRLAVMRRVLLRPTVAGVLAVIALVSNLEWLRDHVLPAAWRSRFTWEDLPQLPWQTWVAISAIAVAALSVEWAFRELRGAHDEFAALNDRMHTERPRLVIGYDLDYPAGYDPTSLQFDSWSPFFIRNDGKQTAYNVSADLIGRLSALRFATLNDYPADGERKRFHIYRDGVKVSFRLMNELLQDSSAVEEIVRGVTEFGIPSEEIGGHVLLRYDSATGLRFYDGFQMFYPVSRRPDGQTQIETVVIRLVHPAATAPAAFSVHA